MGQAFDRDGRALGEAFGDTKREVFDKLMAAHKDAAEIRIRSLDGPSAELPRYRCHKEVWALKIKSIDFDSYNARQENHETDGSAVLIPEDATYGPVAVDWAYVRKHDPKPGGYYVVYKDGYKSFSPADAFEEGYTRP